ncbi:MAG: hypothetical protein HQK49_02680 [Oligoflexia bacterium]|nr:hypothetical protein [Oligoflexia bacterium]
MESTTNRVIKIGLIQLNSKLDPNENLAFIKEQIPKIKSEAIEVLFLPEYFYSLGKDHITPYLVEVEVGEKFESEESEKNQHFQNIKSLAIGCGVYVLGGTAATRIPSTGKIYNRTYNFSPSGELLPRYDKINLFKCTLQQKSFDESKIYTAGSLPLALTLKDLELKIGFAICFDLRFPELFRNYVRSSKVHLLSICAAFTVPTGKAHWHTLLRARAIENQSYVVAAAQVGSHDGGITTYGHSLIIDPWGKVIVDAGGSESDVGLYCAEIDLQYIENIRSRMVVF